MILTGDVREQLATMEPETVQCVVTSPPYWGLRNYGVDGQIGLEATPEEYVATMVEVFREVRRVLRGDGVLFLNLGDSYANDGKWGGSTGGKHAAAVHGPTGIGRGKTTTGLKPKDLCMIPARVALALQADGWYLRSEIVWHKPNPMPESVTDRPTKAHEMVYLLTKSARYFWDADAVREPTPDAKPRDRASNFKKAGKTMGADGGKQAGHTSRGAPVILPNPLGRNLRSVWTIATKPLPEAHFAAFPPALVETCIKAGSAPGDLVLDPFLGAGTVAMVAESMGREWVGIELNPEYVEIAERRSKVTRALFGGCP